MAFGELLRVAPLRPAAGGARCGPLPVEPRDDFLRPPRTVLAQTLAAEVDSLPVALAQFAAQASLSGPSSATPSCHNEAWAARMSGEDSSPGT